MATGDVVAAGVTLSLTIFFLALSGFLALLPLIMDYLRQNFAESIVLNHIIRRACYVVSVFLMMFNSSLLFSLAQTGGLSLNKEILLYIWLFGWGGFLLLVWLVLGTLLDLFKIMKQAAFNERFGD